jgi:hypothetical protein
MAPASANEFYRTPDMLIISIILEAAIAIIAILAARKGKPHIYGLAFTFAVYVVYDLGRLLGWDVQGAFFHGYSCSGPSPLSLRYGAYTKNKKSRRSC